MTPLLDEEFLSKIDRLELVSRRVISGVLKGDRLSRRRGHSNEFADFRPYSVGDDLRFLDWNIYARLDKLFLKLFLEEEDLSLTILLDTSPSMAFGEPTKLLYAKRIAAAMAYVGLVNRDRVRIAAFADSPTSFFGPARGRRHVARMLEVLDGLPVMEGAGTNLARSCRESVRVRSGGGVLLLITDFLDRSGFESGLRYLLSASRTTELFAIHVLSPDEVDPQLSGDLRLRDVEDGIDVEVSTSPALLKRYRAAVESFREDIQQYCRKSGVHYVFTTTAVPFDRLVLEYLRRRGLLR